jgi:glucose-6-phosphate 1-dehydrogenase
MTAASLSSGLLVIFGITGDLTRKKLLPALYYLTLNDLLPTDFVIIGVTRRGAVIDELLAAVKAEIIKSEGAVDDAAMSRLADMMRIVTMDIAHLDGYRTLKMALDAIEDERGVCLNRLFYLAIPPATYGEVSDLLGESKLNTGCQHGSADSRIMVEKPFGYDLESAKELITRLKHSFKESQIFRIDHYLAKETAQNILTFRFANPIFEAVWDHGSISQITLSASESIGVEGRAVFYDPVGALRDFIQSHLIQVLALVTMEKPPAMDSTHIHQAKLKLLDSISLIEPNQVLKDAMRGQYVGYRDEVSSPQSITETFARVKLSIDNERWHGVEIILQTGKKLDRKSTEVNLTFDDHNSAENILTFNLQPNEGVTLGLLAKKPGFDAQTERVNMTFDYHHSFGEGTHPDAYERVLMDGIRGDQTLFATSDEVLASWRILDGVVHEWSKGGDNLVVYEPGTAPENIA